MAPSSRASRTSRTTVCTVDDVFERLDIEESVNGDYSHREAIKYIDQICGSNTKLRDEARRTVSSPSVHFSTVFSNFKQLMRLMFDYGVVLGGYQATAYFYPIVQTASAPWDFYCDGSRHNLDEFITRLQQITMFEKIEDLKSNNKRRLVHFRANANGHQGPISVRVYVAPIDPISAVLDLRLSYQHSIVTPYGAVCFQPSLNKKGQYRRFSSNQAQSAYPTSKAVVSVQLSGMRQEVKPRKGVAAPSIYDYTHRRTKVTKFHNETMLPDSIYRSRTADLGSMVYAVSAKSTRYLGTTANMEQSGGV